MCSCIALIIGLCRDNVVIVLCLLKIDRFQCVLHVDDVVISFVKVSDKYKRSRSAVINGNFIIIYDINEILLKVKSRQ